MDLVNIAYRPKFFAQAPGAQFGAQTANHANSTSPSSASLSNTAAGYSTLGGRWQFAAILTAATDYALFAYQVPATHRFVCDGITITTMNTGAAVATTATILDWSLGVNSTAVSLATTDSGSTFGPRRIPLGVQGFVIGAAIGATAEPIRERFTPIPVEPGRYVHVIVQSPLGTATPSQVIRGDCMISGWFERCDEITAGL